MIQPKDLTTWLAVFSLGLAGLAFAGCEEDGAFEEAGEEVDQTVDDAGEAVDDAGDDLDDAIDDIED